MGPRIEVVFQGWGEKSISSNARKDQAEIGGWVVVRFQCLLEAFPLAGFITVTVVAPNELFAAMPMAFTAANGRVSSSNTYRH